jgi:hypothetical protein
MKIYLATLNFEHVYGTLDPAQLIEHVQQYYPISVRCFPHSVLIKTDDNIENIASNFGGSFSTLNKSNSDRYELIITEVKDGESHIYLQKSDDAEALNYLFGENK